MLESQLQTRIIKDLEKKGWEVIKTIKLNKSGYSDLFVLPGGGRILFIEVKRQEGVESKVQEYRRKQLTKKGYQCYVVYSYQEYLKLNL